MDIITWYPHDSEDPNLSKAYKKFSASMSMKFRPFTFAWMMWLLATEFLTLFLTVPRIMYEAFRLTYFKKLLVYARPEPTSLGAVKLQKPSNFELYCLEIVKKHLSTECRRRYISLTLELPGGETFIFESDQESKSVMAMKLVNYELFTWLCTCGNAHTALACLWSESNYNIEPVSRLSFFVNLFESKTRTGSLSQRLLFPRELDDNGNTVIDQLTATQSVLISCWSFYLAVVLFLMNLITPWAADTDPTPSERVRRCQESLEKVQDADDSTIQQQSSFDLKADLDLIRSQKFVLSRLKLWLEKDLKK